jgi:hypothetical protein
MFIQVAVISQALFDLFLKYFLILNTILASLL